MIFEIVRSDILKIANISKYLARINQYCKSDILSRTARLKKYLKLTSSNAIIIILTSSFLRLRSRSTSDKEIHLHLYFLGK